MVRTERRLRLCVVLLILNIVFIWGNSLLTAELSRAFSSWVKKLLSLLLADSGADGTQSGDHTLRKLAHFTEFTSLGMLLSWLVRMLRTKNWEYCVLPLLGGCMVACADEIIQNFVPGRGPGILDVGIDTLGVAAGIALIYLYTSIKNNFWRKIK